MAREQRRGVRINDDLKALLAALDRRHQIRAMTAEKDILASTVALASRRGSP
jgi:hypothetical protein